jgi:formiminotetrahydrofolate cyclodeaminase
MSDLYQFEAEKKIIEYQFAAEGPLVGMTVNAFTDLLSTEAPAPGGGSVAALCGALSGALSSMVAALTHGRRGYEAAFGEMETAGVLAQALKAAFLEDVDRDTEAFNKVMDAMRLPKGTEAEKKSREAAIQEATVGATRVPLGVLRRSREAAQLARLVVEKGNRNSISDGGVAALAARTAAEGAFLNVAINLPGIVDERFRTEMLAEAERLRGEIVRHTEETVRLAERTIAKEK